MKPVCLECKSYAPTTWHLWRSAEALAAAEGRARDPLAGSSEGTVILSSASRDPGLGRWTVVATCPVAQVQGRAERVTLSCWDKGAWRVTRRGSDPWSAIEALRASFPGSLIIDDELWPPEAPFQGGVLGVLGYGCRTSVESLDPDPQEMEDLWWGAFDTFWLQDHATGRCWAVSWGLTGAGQGCDAGLARARAEALLEGLPEGPAPAAPEVSLALEPVWSREAYGRAFDRALASISAGACYQVCLTYPLRAVRPLDVDASRLFWALQALSPAPFACLVATGGEVAIAGASPERFLSLRGSRVTARPMKGTRARHADRAQDEAARRSLAQATKDQAENVMIVDLMRHDLGRVCARGSVEVPSLFEVEAYQSVFQMTSTITGTLAEGKGALDVVRASFPPGSMTGAPKVQAMKLLAQLEPTPRGWYSGVVGYISTHGDMELSVLIRSAQVSAQCVDWHVGGGLVADSTVDGEWRESLDKCPPAWLSQGKF